MLKFLSKLFTKNYTKVPLIHIEFDLVKYHKNGPKNSCVSYIHPTIKDDVIIKNKLEDLIDYIREFYDMEELCK